MAEPSVVVAAGDGADGAILIGVLRRHGFRVHVASDGMADIRAAMDHRPDVALIDTDLGVDDAMALGEELSGAGVPTAVVGGRRLAAPRGVPTPLLSAALCNLQAYEINRSNSR